jgi:ribulose-5-phosphate 4-epimerase/fuculose-1-phosphate aldolase
MAFFIGNSFCRLCQVDERQLAEEFLLCAKGLSAKGLSFPKNAVHSARLPDSGEMWILAGKLADQTQASCIKVDLTSALSDQIHDKRLLNEILLHAKIYDLRPDVNSICHTKNQYTLCATLNGPLEKVHGEAALILGDIPIIDYNSFLHDDGFCANEKELEAIARASIGEPLRPIRTIILKGNGVLGLGACIHEARAFVEILEEWAMFIVFAKMHVGPHHVLTLEQLRSLGSRHARSIKFGGRQNLRSAVR